MKENVVTNWILVNYTATSLYRVIADGNYRETNAGRAEWISLLNDAKLQPNCNKEGFNVKLSHHNLNLRIGIAGNDENDCKTCDSIIGFGLKIKGVWKWSSGNIKFHPEEKKNTFGYIFVQ